MKDMALKRLIGLLFFFGICIGGADAAELWVDVDGTKPFTQIQAAIDAADAGDVIYVMPGIYEPIVSSNKAITIQSTAGADVTIIDGGWDGSTGVFAPGTRCAKLGEGSDQNDTVLTGFTLRNGSAFDLDAGASANGGGVYGGTLNRCNIVNNRAMDTGGGAYRSILNHCRVAGNEAWSEGGGANHSTLNNCEVSGNEADTNGGGANNSTLVNCIVSRNRCDYNGGGAADSSLYNCVIAFNSAGGADRYVGDETFDSSLDNCTVVGNRRGVDSTSLQNSIVWNTTNNAADPMFLDWENGDFRLFAGSPYAGTGGTSVAVARDMFGNPMVVNGKANWGAIAGTFIAVDKNSPAGAAGNGASWATAFSEIQQAMTIVNGNETVLVADGIYAPIITDNKTLTIRSLNGPLAAIIDANGATNSCANLGATYGRNNTVLEGFTLRNGYFLFGGGVCGGTVNNCIIKNNRAALNNGGGAYYSILNNCVLTGNSAVQNGGGAYDSTLNNCTVVGNTAAAGAGVHGGDGRYSTLNNSIVWGNTNSAGAADETDSVVTVWYCHTHSDYDPLFVDWEGGDFRLFSASPCVHTTGDPSAVTVPTDMFGTPMIQNGYVNKGAIAGSVDESFLSTGTINMPAAGGTATFKIFAPGMWVIDPLPYWDWIAADPETATGTATVTLTIPPNSAGESREKKLAVSTVFVSYQIHYITVNQAGGYVAPREFFVDKNKNGTEGTSWETAFNEIQTAVDAATGGETIHVADGSYAPISTSNKAITIRAVNVGGASINGQGSNRCATLGANRDETNTVLENFYLLNGRVTGNEYGAGARGGTLSNCWLYGGAAYAGGGAAYSVLNNCTLLLNTAQYGGGASDATLNDCTVAANTATVNGGGVHASTVNRSRVYSNIAPYGGGINDGTVNYSLIFENTATATGGGIYGRGLIGANVIGCTIVGNTASNAGGGIAGTVTMVNSIVRDNTAPDGPNHSLTSGTVSYSCTTPPIDGVGNFDADPLFIGGNVTTSNYILRVSSPCRNTGNPAFAGAATTDLNGAPVLTADGKINVGALAAHIEQWTSHRVPYSWLLDHKLVTGDNYEAAAEDDSRKGYPVWHDYVSGVNPTNRNARFTIHFTNGLNIGWAPDLRASGRVYNVYASTNLVSTNWVSPPATNEQMNFFHVTVDLE